MRLWIVTHDEALEDDRVYLFGYLQALFDDVVVSRVRRTEQHTPTPDRPPDLVLNLIGVTSQVLLKDLEAKANEHAVPLSNPADATWRSEDKRSYLADYPEFIPPTRMARTLPDVIEARDAFGGDVVVKDPFSRWGIGVERISSNADLQVAGRLLAGVGCRELTVQPFYSGFVNGDKRVILQRTCNETFEIIGYFARRPPVGGWKSNICSGGKMLRTELTDSEAELALNVAARADLDNIALDIGEHEGRLFLIETNQTFGGIIDFDMDRSACCVSRIGAFLLHLARNGRGHALTRKETQTRPRRAGLVGGNAR